MTVHEWILWPGLLAASAIGAAVVGRRLGPRRRTLLVVAAAAMIVPVAFVVEFVASNETRLAASQLRRWSFYAAVALLGLWALTELCARSGVMDRLAAPLQWTAAALVGIAPVVAFVGWTLAAAGSQPEEGSLRFALSIYTVGGALVVAPIVGAGLASLVPLSLAWPSQDAHPSLLVRKAGTALLIVALVTSSALGLARYQPQPYDRTPEAALDGHEAVATLSVRINPGGEPAGAGNTSARNVTIPLPVSNGSASSQQARVVDTLRNELGPEETGTFVWVRDRGDRWLSLAVNSPVRIAAEAHGPLDVVQGAVRDLRLASGFATSDEPEDVEVTVKLSLCWRPDGHSLFYRQLDVREPGAEGNRTLVGLQEGHSRACSYLED